MCRHGGRDRRRAAGSGTPACRRPDGFRYTYAVFSDPRALHRGDMKRRLIVCRLFLSEGAVVTQTVTGMRQARAEP